MLERSHIGSASVVVSLGMNDTVDYLLGNLVSGRQEIQCHSTRLILRSDLIGLRIGERRIGALLPSVATDRTPVPSFSGHVLKVLGNGAKPKMTWINAIGAIAVRTIMADLKPIRHRTKMQEPGRSMRENCATVARSAKTSINVSISHSLLPVGAGPKPTTSSNFNSFKKVRGEVCGKSLLSKILSGNLLHRVSLMLAWVTGPGERFHFNPVALVMQP